METAYDQSIDATQSIALTTPINSAWDITMQSNHAPTNGNDVLPAYTLNGSTTSAAASTAPSPTCSGSGCTVPALSAAASYPVTISSQSPSIVYAAKASSSPTQLSIPLTLWSQIPASSYSGQYGSLITITTNIGP